MKRTKKLKIARETIKTLDQQALGAAVGGAPNTYYQCAPSMLIINCNPSGIDVCPM